MSTTLTDKSQSGSSRTQIFFAGTADGNYNDTFFELSTAIAFVKNSVDPVDFILTAPAEARVYNGRVVYVYEEADAEVVWMASAGG